MTWKHIKVLILCSTFSLLAVAADQARATLPDEPLRIGTDPQFVHDGFVVDNHWAIKSKRQSVQAVFHRPHKHSDQPILEGEQPSFLWVVNDAEAGVFRMYYQANVQVAPDHVKGRKFATHIAYAESTDGIQWHRPDLDLFDWYDLEPNNVVVAPPGPQGREACGPVILDIPQEKDRRGYKYVMLYRAKGRGGSDVNGIRLVGSHDGIHWDRENDTRIAHLHSDHHNTISYDASRDEYVMYCRAKDKYRAWGEEMIDTGASRRVARMSSKSLWTDWLDNSSPQTILVPDSIDTKDNFNFFYGMPARYFAGIHWGFLEPFRLNDYIYTELVTSRDGIHFHRFPGRPKLIEYGADGTWDDTMIFGSPSWLEMGDEWWFYYTGWDGAHGTTKRDGAIGLAIARKEGLYSMRGPVGGGVVCTRTLIWPGGDLIVNADAGSNEGVLRVRVSDTQRKPRPGFDYTDCDEFRGDSTNHRIRFQGTSLNEWKGEEIRLEFYLEKADLFTFRASG